MKFGYLSRRLGMVLSGVLNGLDADPLTWDPDRCPRRKWWTASRSLDCRKAAARLQTDHWVVPLPANIVLRNFGLTPFLRQLASAFRPSLH